MMFHDITFGESGAECSCGKVFSIWRMNRPPGWAECHRSDVTKLTNCAHGNARRHAEAANRKEAKA